jgi:hypothetical protein
MTPDFLFHPIFDKTKAPTGITDSKVPHPAAQDWVDQRHHPLDRLGLIPPKDVLQLPQKGCQTPLDLVVKFQPIDIVGFIL